MGKANQANTKVIAIVGPQASGKTLLFESLLKLYNSDVTKSSNKNDPNQSTMSTEANFATLQVSEQFVTLIDCPGSIEFQCDTLNAISIADAAIVVCDPKEEKIAGLTPILHELDSRSIPHLLFVNKIDTFDQSTNELIAHLQSFSEKPLVLQEIPLRENNKIVGYIDLISEKAYKYNSQSASTLVKIPSTLEGKEASARTTLLESLADFDDQFMEKLLNDTTPTCNEIHEAFKKDLKEDKLVPVLFGSALNKNGLRYLMNEIIEETPNYEDTLQRLNIPNQDQAVLMTFKTSHLPHKGKMSFVRVFASPIETDKMVNKQHINTLHDVMFDQFTPKTMAQPSQIIAISKMEQLKTGDIISNSDVTQIKINKATFNPLLGKSIQVEKSTDEIKLTAALQKILDEDQSFTLEHRKNSNQLILWGQGDLHLKSAVEKLQKKYNLNVITNTPETPYQETIQTSIKAHGRHKKQTGGHGQFGDVHLEITPLKRGEGFRFTESVTGGAIPKNYFSSVEHGVIEALEKGPLGHPVVDVAVNLFDGSYHRVDSSDLAFKSAAIAALRENLAQAKPVTLEPIQKLTIYVPHKDLASAQKLLTHHKGSIFDFQNSDHLKNWSEISGSIPLAEMSMLITELRSLTQGLGFFKHEYSHMAEIK